MIASPIVVSRSEMVTRQRCPTERWLGYFADDHGWQPVEASWHATFGIELHRLLSARIQGQLLTPSDGFYAALDAYSQRFPDDHRAHIRHEQATLLTLLEAGWMRYVYPQWSREYDLVSSEEESQVGFRPEDYFYPDMPQLEALSALHVPLRLDVLARPKGGDPNLLTVFDWKTTSAASKDWQQKLENSLQSALYVAGVEQLHPQMYCEGIAYWGLVKGSAREDDAKNSDFTGKVIQLGSFLYAWEDKTGHVGKYKQGSRRVYLGRRLEGRTYDDIFTELESIFGVEDMRAYFPTTMPWRPLQTRAIIAQQIFNESQFWWLTQQVAKGHVDPSEVFEMNLDNCYKFGRGHACWACTVCHGGLKPLDNPDRFEPRVHHHNADT